MIRHHLKVTIRSFQRSSSAFAINLIGLSAGILCTLLIILWVQDEFNVDKFHNDSDRIFRAMEHQNYANGDVFTTWSTPGVLAKELKLEIPEVEFASTTSWEFNNLISYRETNQRFKGLHADQDFFKIFTFPIIEGNADNLFKDLNSIAISESLAKSYFGDKSPIGEILEIDKKDLYKVTAVFSDIPDNSTIAFDYVMNAEKWRQDNSWLREWGSNGPRTYVKLTDGADYTLVNEKISNFIKDRNEGSVVELFIYPFAKSYLYGTFENGVQAGGRIEYVQLFSLIAGFILLIACINFMNLSTAKASKKAKEVGIRKALGAYRRSLFEQYMFESLLLTLCSILLAITIIPLILPYFNEITGKEIDMSISWSIILALFAILLFTGLLAGSYPAIYLSAFQPVKVLKNEIKSSIGELWARRGLVVFQFVLSIFLIISVAVIYSQISYVQNKNLGYNKENLIFFFLEGKLSNEGHHTFVEEVNKIPGVVKASASGHGFTGRNNNTAGLWWPEKLEDETVLFEVFRGNHDLISTMGIEILSGRDFSKEFTTDDTLSIIFNEAAINVMKIKDPIGKKVKLWDAERTIVGVTKDFHFESFHSEVSPGFFILSNNLWYAQARLESDNIQKTIEEIKELHTEFNPGFDFYFEFQNDSYAELYKSEERVATLSQYFAGFAILISCLGLFGLASFTAERRIKEIGIRKVLGASILSLMILLSKEFTRLVAIAILIAVPLAWIVAEDWLQDFAYHIDLNIFYFLIAGVLALLIALITVSSQAYSAATINPVKTLKDE